MDVLRRPQTLCSLSVWTSSDAMQAKGLMSGKYIYCYAVMDSLAHFAPRHQNLISLLLEHLLGLVCTLGCQVPQSHSLVESLCN